MPLSYALPTVILRPLPESLTDRIPEDVYLRIVQHLTKRQLAVVLRLSKRFYPLAVPHLYQDITIALHERRHPLTSKLIVANTATVLPIGPQTILNHFVYTTHLTLHSHTSDECAKYENLIMPHLEVLRILRRSECYFLNLCLEGGDYFPLPGSTSPTCHLTSQLRPSQIHLGDPDSGFFGTGAGLYTSTAPFPPPWLEHIVLDIGCATEFLDLRSTSFLSAIPPTVARLTFVLPTRRKDKRWEVVSGADIPGKAYNSWVKLAAAMTGQAKEMEIVGLELVDPTWKSLSADERREKAMGILVYCWMDSHGMKEGDAADRAERITFVELEVFEARQGASGLPDGAKPITSGEMS